VPHHYLGLGLGRHNNKYVKKINCSSKNPPSTNTNEKSTNCSTSITCLASSSSIALSSTCSSSSESLIITNVGVEGEFFFRRSHNVFSSPLIIATRFNASKNLVLHILLPQNSHYFLEIHEVALMQVVQCKLPYLLYKKIYFDYL
jgi:hypothetical protein